MTSSCRLACSAGLVVLLSASIAWGQSAERQELRQANVPIGAEAAGRFNQRFRSWRELQQERIVMQEYDYSCGAAALATMTRYYFGDTLTEAQLLETMLNRLDKKEQEDRQKNGLSMEDLFQGAKAHGYQATVYDLGLKKLKEIEAPVIVRLVKDDFKHFVVYRGYIDDRIYLADPLNGNIRMPATEFARRWNGVALILGKSGFGLPKQHGLSVDTEAPFRPELQSARRYLYRMPFGFPSPLSPR